MAKDPKVCICCQYFNFDSGSPGYSEYTPGTDYSISCDKNHYYLSGNNVTQDKYRETLLKALTCKDWKPRTVKPKEK